MDPPGNPAPRLRQFRLDAGTRNRLCSANQEDKESSQAIFVKSSDMGLSIYNRTACESPPGAHRKKAAAALDSRVIGR